MMKQNLTLFSMFFATLVTVNTYAKDVKVQVTNTSSLEFKDDMVEVSMSQVARLLKAKVLDKFVVTDENNKEIPYQITYDNKLIFQTTLAAGKSTSYTIRIGQPSAYETYVTGKLYAKRKDDLAWENDKIALRAYGPALEKSGEKAFGYDLWTKRTPYLVVDSRYATELSDQNWKIQKALTKIDPAMGDYYLSTFSYHLEHGNGMDCYAVGPTLGGGTNALLDKNGNIIYPYCWSTYKILDNGPLRFTVTLTYNPLTVDGNSNVVETRLISLDKGSYLNKAVIKYEGLKKATPVVGGIVLHTKDAKDYTIDDVHGFVSYKDPTDKPKTAGRMFIGVLSAEKGAKGRVQMFDETESGQRAGASGHIMSVNTYRPGGNFTYYFGFGWDKYDMPNQAAWNNYLTTYAQKLKSPLKVVVK